MRVIDAKKVKELLTSLAIVPNVIIEKWLNENTVRAIPIDTFYKMIANALADTKKENWLPEECPYEYFDGNRNAIHCMLDILCGDKDGDHDTFWDNYQNWEKENE